MIQTELQQLWLGGVILPVEDDGETTVEVLGGFDLTGLVEDQDWISYAVGEGMSTGSAEPQEVVIRNLFGDGSQVDIDGYDNREVTFDVIIQSSDSVALALGEKALFSYLARPSTLLWIPPDGLAPATVFNIISSWARHSFNDEDELHNTRRYTVRLVCQPFPRSPFETLTPALPVGDPEDPTTANINNGSSTTDWTASHAISVVSGAVRVTSGAETPYSYRGLSLADSTSTAVMGYITFVVRSNQNEAIRVFLDGVEVPKIVDSLTLVSGVYTHTITVQATGSAVSFFGVFQNSEDAGYIEVDTIDQSDTGPVVGTARQGARTLTVGGSAPTDGSLEVSHESSDLGFALVATYPQANGYIPALRPRLISSASVTPDTSLVSGARHNMVGTPTVFEMPVAAIPKGTHQLIAKVRAQQIDDVATIVGTFTWTAQTYVGGVAVGTAVSETASFLLVEGAAWQIGGAVEMQLPNHAVPDTSEATVRITLTVTSPGSLLVTCYLDEAWTFWRRNVAGKQVGSLTIVDCGTESGTQKRLFVDAPTDTVPTPMLFVGNDEDRSDSYFPLHTNILAWDNHRFEPEVMSAWLVTAGALSASLALRHYRRWANHAADDGLEDVVTGTVDDDGGGVILSPGPQYGGGWGHG